MARLRRSVLPGFGLSLGYTIIYLSLLVLIPLAALGVKSASLTWQEFYATVTDPFVVSAYKLSVGASLMAAAINSVFGLLVAWVLVRYPFPGRKLLDAIVDLPFALPTAVAGITFASIFADIPATIYWVGSWLPNFITNPIASTAAYLSTNYYVFSVDSKDWWCITLVLVFVGLPFVIRTVQPVLQDWDIEVEQAAMSLGAGPITIFRRIIFPTLFPAWISGVALAFARCVGEFGSVIFVSGNIPGVSQIVPQLIIEKLYLPPDENGVSGVAKATSIGVVLLLMSLVVLLILNGIDRFSRRHQQ